MKILIAVDGTEASFDAVRTAAELVPAGSETILLNVSRPREPALVAAGGLTGQPAADIDDGEDRFGTRDAWEVLRNSNQMIDADELEVALDDSPSDAILDFARAHEIDLIVVGTRDPGVLDRAFGGSVSRAVLEKAPCSVLIAR